MKICLSVMMCFGMFAHFCRADIAGCPLLPANNIWNARVDSLPLDANSATYVNTIGASENVHADFGSGTWAGGPIGIPYTVVPGTQAKVAVSFTYDDESDPGPYPIPPDAPIEGGPGSDGDRHILIVDQDNCLLYELFYAFPQPNGSWQAGSGAIYDLNSNALRPAGWTSADAAGLPILPGLVRYDEVDAGEITHAIRFTAPQTRNTYVWPARHYASALTGAQYPPMGQRFRLKAGVDISGYSPEIHVILTALKRYGMILADNGSSWFISGAPDERWNNDHLHELHQLRGSDFEAVDVSSLMLNSNSGQVQDPPQPPAAPTGVSASDGTYSDRVQVTWNSVSGATSYEVWRRQPPTDAVRIAENVTATSYGDTTAVAGEFYNYRIKAVNAAGTSPLSDMDTGHRRVAGGVGFVADDYDGDGHADIAVFYPYNGAWYIRLADGGSETVSLGDANSFSAPGDYDGDGVVDPAVYSNGAWRIRLSDSGALRTEDWGWSGAMPVPGDYDGDGESDIAVYWPDTGNWYIRQSSDGAAREVNWGWSGAYAAPGDFDGDAITDLAVYYALTGDWYIQSSSDGQLWTGAAFNWGWADAWPVVADYNGDGRDDIAVYWITEGQWYIYIDGGSSISMKWGWANAWPVPADYDGDGLADIAVYWPAVGYWFIRQSSTGALYTGAGINWGWNATHPACATYQTLRWLHLAP